MSLVPRTLLWRTFLLIAALMLLSVLAWFSIFRNYEREPRARQISQLIVSVVNLTRTALVTARPEARRQLLAELSDREGIRIHPAEPGDRIASLPDHALLQSVAALVRERLGKETRFTLEREGGHALYVSFRIEGDEYWIALPREHIERRFPLQWLGWGIAALLLSLAGAWLIVFRVTHPLKALERAAAEIGRGGRPEPLAAEGPEEIATLSTAFNRMSADLARLDEDRALILAGISHDLRTPLTRLRMEIEMTGATDAAREAMAADVEEMDETIGQFLDFARADGGEAPQPTDLAALIGELAEQVRRRGAAVETKLAALPARTLPAQALRRAVANLVDNALRHAGGPVEIALSDNGDVVIEVRDRGPGIPSAEAERLKLPFTRLETARTGATGAGLGLAIVERIARSLGGRLDLLPREGGGLTARITIPG
ncbi:MAG: ATP-binding protein [Candidatus Nitricoxidivorans perseverans]|uniref:histidine kinase n=1 Tax=Candidatus Nitricoxidivorans perseverans TaxID=2975601 RepID=A0AA49FM72_9PROT|nr:MAG: ATP-binding protein [Candidatus Nitricoxidivorans perseverans]